jgi:hypothetical protein
MQHSEQVMRWLAPFFVVVNEKKIQAERECKGLWESNGIKGASGSF